jgi:HK97 family phage major capsid protein
MAPLLVSPKRCARASYWRFGLPAGARAAPTEGAGTTGGYGVPVQIDPSILMTAQGSGNPVLDLARKVDVVTNVWKPVNSAGVTWSFDAEAAEVSDDTPTLGQPSVTVYMARGFVPFSIEVEQDYANFQAEMARLLAEGYNELLAEKLVRGSGTGEPNGYLTGAVAAGTPQVTVTTDGAFG